MTSYDKYMASREAGHVTPHAIKIHSLGGSLRVAECSCGWTTGCHGDRKILRLAETHEAQTASPAEPETQVPGDHK